MSAKEAHHWALDCPYLAGTGGRVCITGCRDEPSCVTDEPAGGWLRRLPNGQFAKTPKESK